MGTYILRRLMLLIPVMLIVGIVVFMLIHMTPGDPAAVILGDRATGEQIEQLRESMGLNEPLLVQFVEWFSNALAARFWRFVLPWHAGDRSVARAGATDPAADHLRALDRDSYWSSVRGDRRDQAQLAHRPVR